MFSLRVSDDRCVKCFAPTRQGCHEFSSELYQSLRTRVASEHFYFWLNSLREFSQAEQCLSLVTDGDYSGAMSAIAEALRSYQKGIASLTVGLLHHEHISTRAARKALKLPSDWWHFSLLVY